MIVCLDRGVATSGLEFRGEVLLQRPGQSPRPTWTKKSGAAQLVPEPARPRGVAMKDKMFHVVSDVFACFLNACCSAQKLEARNLGGRRKLLSRILLYPHIIGSCAPGAAGARTSGHPSTGRTPVYREDTRLQEGPQSTGRTPFYRRTPVYKEDTETDEKDTHLQGGNRTRCFMSFLIGLLVF